VGSSAVSERSKRARLQASTFLEVVRFAEGMKRGFTELLKVHDLSIASYNVLRILRGADDDGLTCGAVSERLVQHDPDVTRLLDRLEKRGLIERRRTDKDRRVVRTSITSAGLALLADLDGPVDDLHELQLGHASDAQLTQLLTLIEDVRKPQD
jgi:DNA-binding MarR family transcriptional regulator